MQTNVTTSRDPGVLELLIPLSSTSRVNTSFVHVLHYELHDPTHALNNPLTATGTVTVNTGSRPHDEDTDDCLPVVRNTPSKVWTDHYWCGVVSQLDRLTHEVTSSSLWQQTTVQTGSTSTKLNLSIMADGKWMGMVPAECYFNSTSSTISNFLFYLLMPIAVQVQ